MRTTQDDTKLCALGMVLLTFIIMVGLFVSCGTETRMCISTSHTTQRAACLGALK